MEGRRVCVLVVLVGVISYIVGSEMKSSETLAEVGLYRQRLEQEIAPIRIAPISWNLLSGNVEKDRHVLDLSGEPILGYRAIPGAEKIDGRDPVIPVFLIYWAKEGIILETNFKVPGSLPGTQHRILVGGR